MQTQMGDLIGTHQCQISVWERADDGHRELPRLRLAMPRIREVMRMLDEQPKEVPPDYAERIRSFRREIGGLYELEFVEVWGQIDYKTLVDWENKKSQPDEATWRRLSLEFVRLTRLPRDPDVEKILKPDARVADQLRARARAIVSRDYPERIKKCRTKMSMSQADFAERILGARQGQVSDWELGKTEPNPQQWEEFLRLELSAPSQGELYKPTNAQDASEPEGDMILEPTEAQYDSNQEHDYEEASQSVAAPPPSPSPSPSNPKLRELMSRFRLELRQAMKNPKPGDYHRLSDMLADMEEMIP